MLKLFHISEILDSIYVQENSHEWSALFITSILQMPDTVAISIDILTNLFFSPILCHIIWVPEGVVK
jgi:hypothetical protein